MYHAACKVEFQPFNRSYSQLTFFNFLQNHHFYFPAQLVGGFTLSDLLDKPWCEVTEYLLAGVPIMLVLGDYSLASEDVREKQHY